MLTMTEYIEREKLYNNLILLAKYETGDRQQGILGCAETVRSLSAADVAPIAHGSWVKNNDSFRQTIIIVAILIIVAVSVARLSMTDTNCPNTVPTVVQG